MPNPANLVELVDLIRKSGVVDETRFSNYLDQIKNDPNFPVEPAKIAGCFIRDGLLTNFQAEQLLLGKWKRFTIGKYKILERIGSGGMGQVFLCEHKLMRRRVAVKVLPTAKASDSSSLERFYREARAVATLDHPNIVRAYDIDQDGNLHFIVMEYVDGISLQDLIKKKGKLDPITAAHYICAAAIGLQHAHEAGLIHRDIKPANILIDRQGGVKILDLGLARFFNDEDDLLTKKYEENILGTADYLSPEQAVDSHNLDGRTDIYSLGATFYFLLVGNPPFSEGSVAQKLLWHQSAQPKPIQSFRDDVPLEMINVLQKMMMKKPQERYSSPLEVALALHPWVETPIPPPSGEDMPQLCMAVQAVPAQSMVLQRPSTIIQLASLTNRVLGDSSSENSESSLNRGSFSDLQGSSMQMFAIGGKGSSTRRQQPMIEPLETKSIPANPPQEKQESTSPSRFWETLDDNASGDASANEESVPHQNETATISTRTKNEADLSTIGTEPSTKLSFFVGMPKKKKIQLISALLIGLVVLITGVSLLLPGSSAPDNNQIIENPPYRSLYISKSMATQEGSIVFRTLRDAISECRSGDHIVLVDPDWHENLEASKLPSNITIESAEGRQVNWWGSVGNSTSILIISSTEKLIIRNIKFQAAKSDCALELRDRLPGLTVENVDFINPRDHSLRFVNCTGDEKQPIEIKNLRFLTNSSNFRSSAVRISGILQNQGRKNTSFLSKNIHISNCVFAGRFSSAVTIDGSCSDFQFRNNRVYQPKAGVTIKPYQNQHIQSYRLILQNNTFHSISDCFLIFETTELMTTPNNLPQLKFDIARNYFYKNHLLVRSDDNKPLPLILSDSNYRDSSTPDAKNAFPCFVQDQIDLPTDESSPQFLYSDQLKKIGPNQLSIGAIQP